MNLDNHLKVKALESEIEALQYENLLLERKLSRMKRLKAQFKLDAAKLRTKLLNIRMGK